MWFVDGVVGVGVFGGEIAGEALYGGWDLDRDGDGDGVYGGGFGD